MRLRADLPGHLVRRYKRFLADIRTADGRVLTVHCPNPGSMLGLAKAGAAVRCSSSTNPRRKLRHTLEMVRAGRIWVGLHTGRAGPIAASALAHGAVRELLGYPTLRSEVAVPGGSRLDFRLDGHAAQPPAFVEVKSVTMARGSVALFPDSVTQRGQRHMRTLESLCRSGSRAALLFVVQRADCEVVRPADDIDPEYGRALRSAARAGVEILALGVRVRWNALSVERRLPVQL